MTTAEALPPAWQAAVPGLAQHYVAIAARLAAERDVRPQRGLWFEALRRVEPAAARVVILGQDPYHGVDHGRHQAHGLAFSVPEAVRPPPSLRNILRELAEDLGPAAGPRTGDLTAWVDQGVLLLNAALTTRGGEAGAHSALWQPFTRQLLAALGAWDAPLVFVLWGTHAQRYGDLIAPHHAVVAAPHPSPLSAYRGFFGSRPFSRVNAALQAFDRPPVCW